MGKRRPLKNYSIGVVSIQAEQKENKQQAIMVGVG